MKSSSFKYVLVILVIVVAGLSFIQPEKPKTGFWAMEGTLITHSFPEKTDSLSGPEIYELQDENGLTLWFSRHIFKDVCISGVCKMIRLWLFWDGTGNYLGMHIPEDEPLTKSDHTLFEPADYEKLEGILRDTASILRDLEQEELIIVPDTVNPYEVDGYTAATQPGLADIIVGDAVYTCHTLWHTVYGPVQDTIYSILNNRINEEYLGKMFSSQRIESVFWAIGALKKYPEFHPLYYPKVVSFISSDNAILSNKALGYLDAGFLADSALQVQLIESIDGSDMSIKYEVLWKFIEVGQVSETAVLKLLQMFHEQKIGVGAYNLILRLITTEHLKENKEVALLLHTFTENENAYIRNLTIKKLDENLKKDFN